MRREGPCLQFIYTRSKYKIRSKAKQLNTSYSYLLDP